MQTKTDAISNGYVDPARIETVVLSDGSVAYNVLVTAPDDTASPYVVYNVDAPHTHTLRIACNNKKHAIKLAGSINGACWVEEA